MPLFLWIICALLVISVVYVVSRRQRVNAYVKNLPKIPFALLAPFLELKSNKTQTELFQCIDKVVNCYNGLASFWMGSKLVVICDDPVNMKTILMSKHCVNKPYFYRMMAAAGNGIFTSTSHDWREDRKGINTVFTVRNLKAFQPIFNRHFADFAKSLENHVDQPEFDFTKYILLCNIGVICKTNFLFDVPALASSAERIIDSIGRLWQIALERFHTFLLQPSFIYRFSSLYAEEKKICDYLFKFSPMIISSRQENRLKELNDVTGDDYKEAKNMILIDKLLELERQNLADRERVRDHINTFIVAGTDTSSITMLNTLLLLAIHPNVQDRLYEEIRSTVTNDEHIEYETLSKMGYLDCVMKESMRLLPLSHIWLRETDDEIQLTDCMVPEGTMLVLCILKMHRNVRIWGPTANDFDPDRFLPEAVAQRHPFAFVPFSAGPRNCIGTRYAIISFKLLLCHLLLKYKFTTSIQMSDIVFRFEFLLKLENKYMLKLEKRGVD